MSTKTPNGNTSRNGAPRAPSPSDAASDAPSPSGRLVRFQVAADPGSKVYLAGTFNNWDPSRHELREEKGIYSITVRLPPGRYEYKFVIDGVWCIDAECPDWAPNGLGSLNSVLTVT